MADAFLKCERIRLTKIALARVSENCEANKAGRRRCCSTNKERPRGMLAQDSTQAR